MSIESIQLVHRSRVNIMAKRRSEIRQAINKAIYTGHHDYRVVYIDRTRERGAQLKSIEARRIAKVTAWAIYLDDDWTVIPLHRIVEIRDAKGRVIWRRSGDPDTK
jgi:uncharacterized protein (UPF0248 family)